MHTPLERLQATTTSACTVGFLMCTLYALSSYGIHHVYPPNPTSSIAVKAVRLNQRTVNATNNRKHDAASLELHIEGDFRSVFHWNVKQVYISCVASYVTEAFALNEVVVWDRIVQNPSEALFVIDVPSKYCLEDIGDSLRNREVTFLLEWHVLPFVGIPFIYRSTRPSERTTIRMPAEYDFSLPNFFKTFMP
ncbi:signal peptidase complex subunit 3B [Perkinsela sp. CCAP 1560/4]|nr:signal peptidase complex subunit 3B [Perkinsela sp. CCAP 1560/4]|eukprot:KNH04117.1 signal peptidase complex subunit 3B [Perkinsela sp. CCAP 1560/4]